MDNVRAHTVVDRINDYKKVSSKGYLHVNSCMLLVH